LAKPLKNNQITYWAASNCCPVQIKSYAFSNHFFRYICGVHYNTFTKTNKEYYMRHSLYNCNAVENLINRYSQVQGNTFTQLYEGVLGYGKLVLKAPQKKTAVITEVPLNEWSSAHKIRMYNNCPKKYQNL